MRLKDNLIKKLSRTYTRIKPSKNKGVGVFAIRNIPVGINPFFEEKSRCIKLSEIDIKNLPKSVQKMISDFYVYDGKYYYVSYKGLDLNDISYFVNHSKKSNLETKDGIVFITKRGIKTGEELTSDYTTYEPEILNK